MSNIPSLRAMWPNLSNATRNRAPAVMLVGAIFLCAFSATIVLRIAIWLALLADHSVK